MLAPGFTLFGSRSQFFSHFLYTNHGVSSFNGNGTRVPLDWDFFVVVKLKICIFSSPEP